MYKNYASIAQEGLGTGLAADVDDVVGVSETVEASGRALGVSYSKISIRISVKKGKKYSPPMSSK